MTRTGLVLGSAIAIGAVLGLRAVWRRLFGPSPTEPDEPLDPPIDDEGCSRHYFPSPNSNPTRAAMPPRWVVLHDTEGGSTARAIAGYFASPASNVSSHLVVDEHGACYRCVGDEAIAWHAGDANGKSLGIELVAPVGAYKRTREQWLQTGKLLDAAADRLARWCRLYGIPVAFVDAAGLRAGTHGITTHAEVTKAFGGSHVDPGADFPLDELLARVRERL